MQLKVVIQLLLLFEEANDCPVVYVHDVVTKLGRGSIRVCLKVVDLTDAKLYLVKSFSQLFRAFLLAITRFVDFALDLIGLLDQLVEKCISLLALQ